MKLLTLNMRNGGRSNIPKILSCLLDHEADILVLAEFRNHAVGAEFRKKLFDAGFTFQAVSHGGHRVNKILIASRPAMDVQSHKYLEFDPVRFLHVRSERFSLIGVHMPNLKAKIPHWNALLELASEVGEEPWVIIGDFNTGRNPQDSEGYKFTCANHMEALENKGWIEAWRHLHPEAGEYSWYSHKGRGFRLDHAFLSPPLGYLLKRAAYDHVVREKGYSDHSALVIDLAL